MDTYHKNTRESFVLADMHNDGVYFDAKILKALKTKVQEKVIQQDSHKA